MNKEELESGKRWRKRAKEQNKDEQKKLRKENSSADGHDELKKNNASSIGNLMRRNRNNRFCAE